jgi:hypothetical protein
MAGGTPAPEFATFMISAALANIEEMVLDLKLPGEHKLDVDAPDKDQLTRHALAQNPASRRENGPVNVKSNCRFMLSRFA